MSQNKFIVIIPTYNNPNTIKAVVQDVLNHKYPVIVVDDGSDIEIKSLFTQTEQEAIVFVKHEQNQGKGQAIVSGTHKAKELAYDFVVSIDGDSQHLASEVHKLTNVYEEDSIIIGARNFDLEHVPLGSKFGRWFSNIWAKLDTGQNITDSLSGYRIYPLSILDLPIKTQGFDWEIKVIVRHADAGRLIKEVIIECYYPSPEERVSHFRKFGDTMAIVWVHLQILSYKGFRFLSKPFYFLKRQA